MIRWLALLLMLVLIGAGIKSESVEIEQQLHRRVVSALEEEGLSEVRVQLDGRGVLLSGPEAALPQAKLLTESVFGVKAVELKVVSHRRPVVGKLEEQPELSDKFNHKELWTQATVIQPVIVETQKPPESELLITKLQKSVEVSGQVPNHQIRMGVLSKIEHLVEIPDDLYEVSINEQKTTPNWYSQGLPLVIPFVQWVDDGKLYYQENKILVEGLVLDKHAKQALETAIMNISTQFQIENRLQVSAE